MQIDVNGEILFLDSTGAIWWPAELTLVFADLHFEKGSSFARRGQFLPPYDTRATLARMNEAVSRFKPARIIALGDSFHDAEAADRLAADDRQALGALAQTCEWIWIAGNHDPVPPAWLGGVVCAEFKLRSLTFRHEPSLMYQVGEIAGHLHPCATVRKWGRAVRRPCFVSDGRRMVLPSFGAYTGGLDVRDNAIADLFSAGFLTYLLGAGRVYAVPA